MNNISLDTQVQSHLNSLMMVSLNHSAAVIEYATQNIVAGPAKYKREYKRRIDGFKKIHDNANAQHIKLLEELERMTGDDRN